VCSYKFNTFETKDLEVKHFINNNRVLTASLKFFISTRGVRSLEDQPLVPVRRRAIEPLRKIEERTQFVLQMPAARIDRAEGYAARENCRACQGAKEHAKAV
jgi:hypothetical protein